MSKHTQPTMSPCSAPAVGLTLLSLGVLEVFRLGDTAVRGPLQLNEHAHGALYLLVAVGRRPVGLERVRPA